ncbi:SMI1/KNR4 family protein [uncultured Planococcus sp.]|uniref:SMI1/KNR4 family protein n=1 Tax=uncultured Planococcus sp. TaxID=337815 RepID=UPI0026358E43|nr:SMI1/KNR4 family protein [uncultured Planococcus sp.]
MDLPKELEDLLSETDGVYDEFICLFIWSINKLSKKTSILEDGKILKIFICLLIISFFFSNAGNGDLFGYAVLNGHIQSEDIYVWNHEDDSRTWIASSLKEYIKGWITGGISILKYL